MWSADGFVIHLASYEKWHFYLRSDGHTLPNFDGFLSFFFSMLLPFLPAMQLFAYAKSNTFFFLLQSLVVILYRLSWTWNSHTYSLTHSNVICWCARNTFGLIWKMTLLRSYGHTLPNFDGLLQFSFSMGPRYTRSLTNTISSTPMKINSKFFYLKFN